MSRWDFEWTLHRQRLDFDVVFFDSVGMPYIGDTYRHQALGGSEFETVLVAEELAKVGAKVAIFNNTLYAAEQNGVKYYNHSTLNKIFDIHTGNLVVLRSSQAPKNINFGKIFLWVTDLYNEQAYNHLKPIIDNPKLPFSAIYVSEFQKSIYPPHWRGQVIPNMLPDWVYDYKTLTNEHQYVYASAAMKGLTPTLALWAKLKQNNYLFKKAKLLVLSPGYDKPDDSIKTFKDVQFLGSQNFENVVKITAQSRAMFMASQMPETFGIAQLMAEVLGTKPFILALNVPGGLSETINHNTVVHSDADKFLKMVSDDAKNPIKFNKDSKVERFKASNVIKLWVKALTV